MMSPYLRAAGKSHSTVHCQHTTWNLYLGYLIPCLVTWNSKGCKELWIPWTQRYAWTLSVHYCSLNVTDASSSLCRSMIFWLLASCSSFCNVLYFFCCACSIQRNIASYYSFCSDVYFWLFQKARILGLLEVCDCCIIIPFRTYAWCTCLMWSIFIQISSINYRGVSFVCSEKRSMLVFASAITSSALYLSSRWLTSSQ